MDPAEVNDIYLETMRQMDIDFHNEMELINKIKFQNKNLLPGEILNLILIEIEKDRTSFFDKYRFVEFSFFQNIDMRKDFYNTYYRYHKLLLNSIW
jgi:hypothetical protein